MNKQSSRSSLFLIELVLSIFFFIVAAAICLQLFISTYFYSRETVETNQALLWSQNLAEPFLGSMGEYPILKDIYADADCINELSFTPEEHILLCFDKNWNFIQTLEEASYLVFSNFHSDQTFAYQDIYISKCPNDISCDILENAFIDLLCDEDYQIYQLSVKKFIY